MVRILKDMRGLSEALKALPEEFQVKADLERMTEAEISNALPAAEAQLRSDQFDKEVLARIERGRGGEK